ncbi:MAG: DUF4340 domain-containing protein [Oligoflexus sp.]
MKPNIRIYIILFVIGLAVSYFVSDSEQDQAQSGQKWLSLKANEFQSLRYQDNKGGILEIQRLPKTGYWASYAPNGQAPEGFKVRNTIDDLIKFWADLRVLRVIGATDEVQLEDYDLAESEHTLQLQFGENNFRYIVGKKGFQSQDHFILDQQKNQVLMISRRGLQALQNAKNELYERDILVVDLEKIDRIEVEGKDKKLVFKGLGKGSGQELRWIREGLESEDDETASSWMNRMLRLQIRAYEDHTENTRFDDLESVLHFRFFDKDKQLEEMQIRSTISSDEQKREYRLKSENTYGYVRLYDSRLETLINDFEAMESN